MPREMNSEPSVNRTSPTKATTETVSDNKDEIALQDSVVFIDLLRPGMGVKPLNTNSAGAAAMQSAKQPREMRSSSMEISHLSENTIASIINAAPGQQIKFTIEFPGRRNVDVSAHENKAHWHINLATKDFTLRNKLKKGRKQLAYTVRKQLGKKVLIDVE